MIPELGCVSCGAWKASSAIWVLAALSLAAPGRHLVSPAPSPGSLCSQNWLILGDSFSGGSQLFSKKDFYELISSMKNVSQPSLCLCVVGSFGMALSWLHGLMQEISAL